MSETVLDTGKVVIFKETDVNLLIPKIFEYATDCNKCSNFISKETADEIYKKVSQHDEDDKIYMMGEYFWELNKSSPIKLGNFIINGVNHVGVYLEYTSCPVEYGGTTVRKLGEDDNEVEVEFHSIYYNGGGDINEVLQNYIEI